MASSSNSVVNGLTIRWWGGCWGSFGTSYPMRRSGLAGSRWTRAGIAEFTRMKQSPDGQLIHHGASVGRVMMLWPLCRSVGGEGTVQYSTAQD